MVHLSTRECKKRSGVYDHYHCGDYLFAASRNVHSLVECVGDARTCGVSKMAHLSPDFPDDRKLSLLVNELQHYHVSLSGIQETSGLGQMFG